MKTSHCFVLSLVWTILCLTGCRDQGRTLPSATGTIYEMLVVVDKPLWEGSIGDSIRSVMAGDMPCLPQMEPYFSLSQVSPALFDDFLKPTRNILWVDINPDRYTQCKIRYLTDVYSKPQAVCLIQCPNAESFASLFEGNGEAIRQWFVMQELTRQGRFYRNYETTDVREAVQSRFGCDIFVPSDYILVSDTADFVWAVCDAGSLRRDLVVWSYPYVTTDQLTLDSLLEKRNQVLGAHVHGTLAGSHMGTEYRHFPPALTVLNRNNNWCAEVRGLWTMLDGGAMGGPFVQHTRIDELNGRIVTAEVFILAPGQKKRNPLRQAEAILYTLRFTPQELEAK